MITSSSYNIRNISKSIDKLENDLISMMWNTYTNDQSFIDIFTDIYLSEDGIDKSVSSYQYDSINFCLSKPTLTSLVLITVPWVVTTSQISSIYSILDLGNTVQTEPSTDFYAYISFDNGTSYSQIVNQSIFKQISTRTLIRGDLGISISNNSNQIRFKIVCNSPTISIYGVSVGVR